MREQAEKERDVMEKKAEAGPFESAKSYRKRIFPLVEKVANTIVSLYIKYIELKNKYKKLSDRNDRVENRVERLRDKLSATKEEKIISELFFILRI